MSNRNTYQYNPACSCEWCTNNGEVPLWVTGPNGTLIRHPLSGHSYGYGNEHMPPSRPPWTTDADIIPLPTRNRRELKAA